MRKPFVFTAAALAAAAVIMTIPVYADDSSSTEPAQTEPVAPEEDDDDNKGLLQTIIDGVDSISDDIWSLPSYFAGELYENAVKPILEGIKGIFVPDEDFITEKVEDLRTRFAFADSIIATVDAIKEAFLDSHTEPPVITADLSSAESRYNYGTTVYVLDLTWYSRYKPTVDAFLSSVIIVFFVWRVFIRLPSILSGQSGSIEAFYRLSR